jgi:hypothetical protein
MKSEKWVDVAFEDIEAGDTVRFFNTSSGMWSNSYNIHVVDKESEERVLASNPELSRPYWWDADGALYQKLVEEEVKLDFEQKVDAVLAEVKAVLMRKNKTYGNSALKPVKIFSKAAPGEQLASRMDDKLSRIANGCDGKDGEDTRLDLIGYLVLDRINRGGCKVEPEARDACLCVCCKCDGEYETDFGTCPFCGT